MMAPRKRPGPRIARRLVEGSKRRFRTSFATQFVRNPGAVGTMFRSGPMLARRITSEAFRFRPRIVVEVGCGDGAITRALARASKRHGARFVALDINAELLARNPACGALVRADAAHLPIKAADVIVSGLPLALIPREVVVKLLHAFRALAPHFVQFQYSTGRYRSIRRVYPGAKVVSYVLSNLPPAVVIVA